MRNCWFNIRYLFIENVQKIFFSKNKIPTSKYQGVDFDNTKKNHYEKLLKSLILLRRRKKIGT